MGSNEVINDLDFEEKILSMGTRELLEFTARQVYDVACDQPKIKKRLAVLESRDKKFFGIVGSLSGIIGAAIAALINHLFLSGKP